MEQSNRKMNTILMYDSMDSVTILGRPEDEKMIMSVLRKFNIDPDLLLGTEIAYRQQAGAINSLKVAESVLNSCQKIHLIRH